MAADNSPMPVDGIPNLPLTFNTSTNRIDMEGFQYDSAGNQTRALGDDGIWLKYEYDAANRIRVVKHDDGSANGVGKQAFMYGSTNARLIDYDYGVGMNKLFASVGGTTLNEYTEYAGAIPTWTKSYTHLGSSQLSTITPNGSGGETVEFDHPDRLGNRLKTNPTTGSVSEQAHLPFGRPLNAETSQSLTTNNRRFTSYDRSNATGLDYAVNRTYDSKHGRFTQVDPIGMKSVDLNNPQMLNLYAYCANDPINQTDPDGLGFFSWLKKLWKGIGKLLSAVGNAIAKVLNNRWVRLGIFIASFLIPIPGVQAFLGKALTAAIKFGLKAYNIVADIASSMQLAGMLLQGKFRELGVALGMGLISSAISSIADSVIRGVKESMTKGGKFSWKNFSLKGVFSGAWKGFTKGLKGVFGRGWNSLIPIYGRYCGPGLGLGAGETAPGVDGIDNACKKHDGWYGTAPTANIPDPKLVGDIGLFKSLFTALSSVGVGDIVFGGRPSGGNSYRFLAIPLFGGLIVYRKVK